MDSSYVMIVPHIPPWIKKEYFVRLGVEHLPKGLQLLLSLLLSPPPLPNLNLLHRELDGFVVEAFVQGHHRQLEDRNC